MRVRVMCRVIVAGGLCGLAACGPKSPSAAVPPCETVVGQGTSYTRGIALRRAEYAARAQLPDVRGDLIGVGLRRVRLVGQHRTCEPYRFAGFATGAVTCSVHVRVCGRTYAAMR